MTDVCGPERRKGGERGMSKPFVPWSIQASVAALAQNSEMLSKIISTGLCETEKDLSAVASSYDRVDLPIMLAAMRLFVQGITPTLTEEEKQRMDDIISHSTSIAIDSTSIAIDMYKFKQ